VDHITSKTLLSLGNNSHKAPKSHLRQGKDLHQAQDMLRLAMRSILMTIPTIPTVPRISTLPGSKDHEDPTIREKNCPPREAKESATRKCIPWGEGIPEQGFRARRTYCPSPSTVGLTIMWRYQNRTFRGAWDTISGTASCRARTRLRVRTPPRPSGATVLIYLPQCAGS
jgi:hypothetical protein